MKKRSDMEHAHWYFLIFLGVYWYFLIFRKNVKIRRVQFLASHHLNLLLQNLWILFPSCEREIIYSCQKILGRLRLRFPKKYFPVTVTVTVPKKFFSGNGYGYGSQKINFRLRLRFLFCSFQRLWNRSAVSWNRQSLYENARKTCFAFCKLENASKTSFFIF